jgi:hypothetical protein
MVNKSRKKNQVEHIAHFGELKNVYSIVIRKQEVTSWVT